MQTQVAAKPEGFRRSCPGCTQLGFQVGPGEFLVAHHRGTELASCELDCWQSPENPSVRAEAFRRDSGRSVARAGQVSEMWCPHVSYFNTELHENHAPEVEDPVQCGPKRFQKTASVFLEVPASVSVRGNSN